MANADGLRASLAERARSVVEQAVDTVAHRVREDAPVREGTLRDSVQAGEVQVDGPRVSASIVAGAEHASWQDRGTGVYGPSGQPIRPVRAKVLAWDGPDGPVFARQVAGTPPTWFWSENVNPEAWAAALADALG